MRVFHTLCGAIKWHASYSFDSRRRALDSTGCLSVSIIPVTSNCFCSSLSCWWPFIHCHGSPAFCSKTIISGISIFLQLRSIMGLQIKIYTRLKQNTSDWKLKILLSKGIMLQENILINLISLMYLLELNQ